MILCHILKWLTQIFDAVTGGSRIFLGGAPTHKCTIILQIFCRKLHEYKRIWTGGVARSWRPPLDPPMAMLNFLRWHKRKLYLWTDLYSNVFLCDNHFPIFGKASRIMSKKKYVTIYCYEWHCDPLQWIMNNERSQFSIMNDITNDIVNDKRPQYCDRQLCS